MEGERETAPNPVGHECRLARSTIAATPQSVPARLRSCRSSPRACPTTMATPRRALPLALQLREQKGDVGRVEKDVSLAALGRLERDVRPDEPWLMPFSRSPRGEPASA